MMTIFLLDNKNSFRGDAIRLGDIYDFDDAHNAILEKNSNRELNNNELILEREVESSDNDSEYNN